LPTFLNVPSKVLACVGGVNAQCLELTVKLLDEIILMGCAIEVSINMALQINASCTANDGFPGPINKDFHLLGVE
jgi:hypothetical protein